MIIRIGFLDTFNEFRQIQQIHILRIIDIILDIIFKSPKSITHSYAKHSIHSRNIFSYTFSVIK